MFILVKSSPGYESLKSLANLPVFVLDFDGIIVNLNINWSDVKAYINRKLKLNIDSLLAFWHDNFGRNIYNEVSGIVENYERKALREAKPFPDVRDSLETLLRHNKAVYLATMQSREPVEEFLEENQLKYYFKGILTRDDFGSKKDQLREIMSMENTKPSDILLIDNSIRYVPVCAELGINCVILPKRLDNTLLLVIKNILEDA